MVKRKRTNAADTFVQILIAALALSVLKALFESDNSKIISKRGISVLSDEEEMKEVSKKILKAETDNHGQEVFI